MQFGVKQIIINMIIYGYIVILINEFMIIVLTKLILYPIIVSTHYSP